jgi:hypothetical protein
MLEDLRDLFGLGLLAGRQQSSQLMDRLGVQTLRLGELREKLFGYLFLQGRHEFNYLSPYFD